MGRHASTIPTPLASGRADEFNEPALLPESISEIFSDLLGYTGPAASAHDFTLSHENPIQVDGQRASPG